MDFVLPGRQGGGALRRCNESRCSLIWRCSPVCSLPGAMKTLATDSQRRPGHLHRPFPRSRKSASANASGRRPPPGDVQGGSFDTLTTIDGHMSFAFLNASLVDVHGNDCRKPHPARPSCPAFKISYRASTGSRSSIRSFRRPRSRACRAAGVVSWRKISRREANCSPS